MSMSRCVARPHRLIAPVLVVAAAAFLGGCAGGDFGRVRASALSDDMHSWIGVEATGSIGQRASDFQLTEAERQLRDLAYPMIEPPHSRPAWKGVFGNYDPMPAPWRQDIRFDRTAYGRKLIDEPHRTHASRYSQLMDDVRNDLTRFDPFFQTAAAVGDMDGKRNKSLKHVSALSRREYDDAIARMEENRLVVKWVNVCLRHRIESYRWALERLIIHGPDDKAAEADRLIAHLAARLNPAEGYAIRVNRGAAVVKD